MLLQMTNSFSITLVYMSHTWKKVSCHQWITQLVQCSRLTAKCCLQQTLAFCSIITVT